MAPRLTRLTPLTGLAYAVLSFAAFGTANGAPSAGDSGARVIAFYDAHRSSAQASDQMWTFAFVFFVFFAATLASYAGRAPAARELRRIVVAGAAMLAVGAIAYFGFDFVLASAPADLSPAAAQAINQLALKLFFPAGAGALVFGIGAGLMIIRGSLLPRWVGWTAVAVAITTISGIPGLMLLAIWSAAASVLLFRRLPKLAPSGDVEISVLASS